MSQERLLKVLLRPHVSDKAYMSAEKSGYTVFRVARDAKKLEIKKAVEQLFEVKVNCVNTVNVKGKARRFGRVEGKTKDWKKAYIKLADGYDINFLGE